MNIVALYRGTSEFNTLRTGDANLRLYAYKQFKYPVPSVLGYKSRNNLVKDFVGMEESFFLSYWMYMGFEMLGRLKYTQQSH
jgi:hypothetical protein